MCPSDYNLGKAIVVSFAPHQKLIKRSNLLITHAGLNTVLGALAEAKPMVAIPITSEQPGIAARLKRCGAGEIIPVANLSINNLRKAVHRVLKENNYKDNAQKIQQAIKKAGGAKGAANIIELAISTNKPVLASSCADKKNGKNGKIGR